MRRNKIKFTFFDFREEEGKPKGIDADIMRVVCSDILDDINEKIVCFPKTCDQTSFALSIALSITASILANLYTEEDRIAALDSFYFYCKQVLLNYVE